MKFYIDINADVGEGLGIEAELMPFLSSCNIACGGHAGDEKSMETVVDLCKSHSVKIGAHPSFPDKRNFGRINMNISCADLYTSLRHQIRSLLSVLEKRHSTLNHIKPHGALYNLAAKDEKVAIAVIELVKSIDIPVKLYAPYNSVLATLAENENITVVPEAFIDRNYNEDLSLVSRGEKFATIEDPKTAYKHLQSMVLFNKLKTISGYYKTIKAETFCIHGDNPKAMQILKHIAQESVKDNILIC